MFLIVCVDMNASLVSPVLMHQHVDDLFEQVGLLRAEESSSYLVDGLFELGQAVVVFSGVVSKQRKGENDTFRENKSSTRLVPLALS